MSSRWMRFVDELRGWMLGGVAVGITIGFAIAYYVLTLLAPSHGLHSASAVNFFDALFFSIVTGTTLGFGDTHPMGLSKGLVSLHVILGIILAGLAVAKLTSSPGREMRLLAHKVSGDWIETLVMKDGARLVSHAVFSISGERLLYTGENFDKDGRPLGFFEAHLVDVNGRCLRFSYSNENSSTDLFVRGFINILFSGESPDGRWIRHQATNVDTATKENIIFSGFRASEGDQAILNDSDGRARQALLKKYAERQ